jgi:hypothetical protein
MFLAGKVEETPRPLKDVILVSYEIIHKKDPEAVQRIKQKVICLCKDALHFFCYLFISPSSGIWIPHHHFSPFLIFKI